MIHQQPSADQCKEMCYNKHLIKKQSQNRRPNWFYHIFMGELKKSWKKWSRFDTWVFTLHLSREKQYSELKRKMNYGIRMIGRVMDHLPLQDLCDSLVESATD